VRLPRPIGAVTRNAEGPLLLESFFVAAVASFLGIRWFLALTGYPQVGSNGLHIAHMLWGGLLMLLAILLLMSYLDRTIQHAAAAIAGLGFGTFIDEIGKFVTADNNYFYRPAIALIYVLFVIAFLLARVFVGRRQLSEGEALANALHGLASTSGTPIEPDDRARVARMLSRADPDSAQTQLLWRYLAAVPGAAERRSVFEIARKLLSDVYERVMANAWADRALTIGVIGYTALALAGVAVLVLSPGAGGPNDPNDPLAVSSIAQIVSTIAGALLIGIGVVNLTASRLAAFRWFMRGILVWILITQVFVFYRSELAGLGGLVVDLVAYGSLRFALQEELGRDPSSHARERVRAGPISRSGG
jgi:hypothetical protein